MKELGIKDTGLLYKVPAENRKKEREGERERNELREERKQLESEMIKEKDVLDRC